MAKKAAKAGGSGANRPVAGHGPAGAVMVAGEGRKAGGARFAEEASARLREAQAALTDLLDDAGLGGARPTEIGRTLGVDKTLAWKIARFVEEPEAVGAARHMPGSAGVEIVLKAAAAHGVAVDRVDAVRGADGRLRAFVRRHAGDRRSFEAMLARGGRDDRIESEERRALYKSGSAVWGVRAKAQFLTLALRPSETDPATIDVLQLSGMVGFERLRADVPWIIRRLTNRTDSGSSSTQFAREPLDPDGVGVDGGLPLIPRLCSRPLPEIRQFRAADGTVYDEIAPGAVGRNGAVSFVAGEVYRGAIPLAWSADNTEGRYTLAVRTPVEAVVFDLLLDARLTHFGEPSVRVYGLLEDRPTSGASGGGEPGAAMYEPEPAHALGTPPVLQSTRISGHAGVVGEAMAMGGWDPGAFRGYRAELEFPPAPCRVMMVCPARHG
tara:strand:- start:3196 stop:4512 length:1317 start_codon:yes stop_codon:yes gene_type:complete